MSTGSMDSLVTFRRSFKLSALEAEQPPGTYRIVFDYEEVAGLSFLAYRRVAAIMHLPSLETSKLARQFVLVDSDELEAAISADHGSIANETKGLSK